MPRPPFSPPDEPPKPPPRLTKQYRRAVEDAAALMQRWADRSKGDTREAYLRARLGILGLLQPAVPDFLKAQPFSPRDPKALPAGRNWPYW
jgi:hypothetical protein